MVFLYSGRELTDSDPAEAPDREVPPFESCVTLLTDVAVFDTPDTADGSVLLTEEEADSFPA